MLFHHRIEFHEQYAVLVDESSGISVSIPYEHLKKVGKMLVKADTGRKASLERNVTLEMMREHLTGEAEKFVESIVEMGLVIPIQKQAGMKGDNGR